MGRVWRAADEMLDREVAVKEMRIDGLDAEDARTRRERALREARATARIDHPNVVRIYDVVDEGERLWIVMELVAGRSLERMMVEDGPLGPLEAARIGVGLVTALRQVHARGVLHRDIKPGNVLVERNGHRVVLTDFGIAAIQDAKALTMVGMLVGSPDYMAPERISGRPQGPPSDIWSLGATLCAAMGGHSPFSRDTTLATLHAVLYEEPELPSAAGPLRDILAALLEKDPDVRPGLAELEIALHPVAFPTPTPTVTVRGAEELREEKRPPEPGAALPDTDPGSRPVAAPSRPRATEPKPHPHPETPEHLAGAGPEGLGRPVAPESEAARGPASEGEAAGGSGTGEASESPTPSAPTPRTPPPDHAPPDRATPQLPWAPHESPTPAYLDASRVPAAWDPRRPEPEPEAVHDAIPQQRTAPAQTQQPATHEPAAHPARTERPVSLDRPTPPPALNPGNASTEAAASTSSEVRSETPVGSPAGAVRGVSLDRSEALTERRPVHEPPLGTEPGELPGPARPAGPRRPHRRTGLLAAAAVVTAGAVVAVVLLMNSGSPGGNQADGSPTPSPTVSGTPSPTVEGTSRPQSLPPGAHREAGGFAWATPEGWRRDVKTGAEVHYTSPDGRQELVAKSSLARGDLMETWETSEANAHQGEDYQKIRLEETKFRDYPAVVWEYTFTLKGTKWHARLLGFNADGKSYQINTWYQPDIENQAVKTYDKVTDSFTIL
ncbi:protein kinase domain-containing protein [Streptomyces sp. NBC_00019]|uniref:serine/threonine-protein kinase n=1 Tax=Streptomyces sp. NBC_00019 TaxID=2975623 RepID=UPI00324C9B7C